MPMLIDTIDDASARAACARAANRPDALIEILHDVQRTSGFVGDRAIATIADALNLSRAEVLGVLSFYHDFRRQPGPRHILKLCRAEACQAVGGEALANRLEAALASAADRIEIRSVYCLGNCALGPAALLDDRPIGRLDPDALIDELTANGALPGDVE
ncbi:NAD(P)H-dependent oxidoreductase subunit E [Maricaulis maris]|uniref:NAD(P)H-dependent oxidoreductase subunit E n=1 Tax=Maricaulis maris TaxID=74318 RepID=UPI003B8CF45B